MKTNGQIEFVTVNGVKKTITDIDEQLEKDSSNPIANSTVYEALDDKADNVIATSEVAGLVKLGDDTVQETAANPVTSTAYRTYGVQLNSDNQMVVNVPWVAYEVATASKAGLVKPISVITKPTIQTATTTAGRYYGVQMSDDGTMFVNVPWVAYEVATASKAGLVKPISVITKPTIQTATTTAGRYYGVQMSDDGTMFVNVPWSDNNTTYSAGTGLSLSGTTFSLKSSGVTALTGSSGITISVGQKSISNISTYDYLLFVVRQNDNVVTHLVPRSFFVNNCNSSDAALDVSDDASWLGLYYVSNTAINIKKSGGTFSGATLHVYGIKRS